MVVRPEEIERILVKFVDRRLLVDIPEINTFKLPYFIFKGVFTPSLSFLYGYNTTKRGFVALRVTEEGQLLVSGISPATEWYATKTSVTDTGTVIDLGKEYSVHLIINDGPNSVYVAWNRAATTNDFELKPGEYLEVALLANKIGLICNSGESATVRILSRG